MTAVTTSTVPAPRRGAGGARRRDRTGQRALLLDVTARLVAEEGTAAVTMERVAGLAGVSKPVVYKSFSDRGDLLCALLERCWLGLDESVQRRLRAARSFDAHVAALVSSYFEELARQGRVLQVLLAGAAAEPALEAARRDRHRDAERQWSEFYQRRGGLAPDVADAAAAMLRRVLEGGTAYAIEHPRSDRDVLVATCTDVMRGALDRLRRHRLPAERPAARARPASGPAPASAAAP
jgi:AcrR family transcriptional regulator